VILPRYPIYIPSRGRSEACSTARFLAADGVPFSLVVEEPERDAYAARFGDERVLVLPFRDRGSVVPARNWIKDHATATGALRHWQIDDNIGRVRRWAAGRRIPCASGPALAAAEDFADRFENVAIAGLDYTMFCIPGTTPRPYVLNTRVYSCALVLNALPFRWRGRYNEDTDLCLQVLANGWCTVLLRAFMVDKASTMQVKGGNTAALYQGDGRLRMARALERLWPHVVTTERRFKRPQHVVRDHWRKFDTPLRRKPGLVVEAEPNNYGLTLRAVDEVRDPALRRIAEERRAR
jgi:hypothetical protein